MTNIHLYIVKGFAESQGRFSIC